MFAYQIKSNQVKHLLLLMNTCQHLFSQKSKTCGMQYPHDLWPQNMFGLYYDLTHF